MNLEKDRRWRRAKERHGGRGGGDNGVYFLVSVVHTVVD